MSLLMPVQATFDDHPEPNSRLSQSEVIYHKDPAETVNVDAHDCHRSAAPAAA